MNGIENLIIEKRSGQSSNGAENATGLPSTYPGTYVNIDPENHDVIWNAAQNRWEVTFDVEGFSGFFVKTSEYSLPVRLSSFHARNVESKNYLKWSTVEEQNSKHFDIQRSGDGKNWSVIGSVAALNLNTGSHEYIFTDPMPMPGNNLYRLKMVDLDGTFTFSSIESAKFLGEPMMLYPNPVITNVHLNLPAHLIGSKVTLLNATGLTVGQFSVTSENFKIDLRHYSPGIYLVKTLDGLVYRLVKQ